MKRTRPARKTAKTGDKDCRPAGRPCRRSASLCIRPARLYGRPARTEKSKDGKTVFVPHCTASVPDKNTIFAFTRKSNRNTATTETYTRP